MKLIRNFIFYIILANTLLGSAQTKLIFDTDFGGDADDLGALAMLNNFQNKGECDLLAVMCWNTEKYAVSAIDAVNTFYGNPDIPIGLRKGEITQIDWNHSKVIADNLDHDSNVSNAPNATQLYRKLLSESENESIVIVTVGPLMNIKNLLESQPDHYSPLSGMDLVHAKVKEFVIMGGQFPQGSKEWNFDGGMKGITQYVLEKIECPITFLGYEIGLNIKTGEIFNELPKDSPLYLGFFHFSKNAPWLKQNFKGKIFDNATYDQTAVLYAIRNGLGTYWHRSEKGRCVPDEQGGNVWQKDPLGNHTYLILAMKKSSIEVEIENFMINEF